MPKPDSLRVLLLNDTLAFAGTECHLLDLALGLMREGVDVSIACRRQSALWERTAAAGISLHSLEYRGLLDVVAVSRLSALISNQRIDVVHAHNGKTAWLGVLTLSRTRNFQLVFTQHFLEPAHTGRTGLRGWIWRVVHRWVERRISQFIAISEAVRQGMLTRGEASPAKLTVIQNGIAAPKEAGLKDPNEIRQQLGIGVNAPLVVCVARLEPEKDCASLLRAMAKVKLSDQQAHCAVVGSGSELELLERLSAELNLTDNVTFVGFQSDAYSWINSADLFVLPSLAEPFGLVLLEAMALGKPVVAVDAGGPREIVANNLTGFLVSPKDPNRLADAILDLVSNPAKRLAMGTAGQARYRERFTSDRMARETTAVYNRALGLRQPNQKARA